MSRITVRLTRLDLPSHHTSAPSELCDERNPTHQKETSGNPPDIQGMGFYAKPVEMINNKGSHEGGGYREAYKRTRSDLINTSKSRIYLYRSHESANHRPPGHCSQILC